MRFIDFFAGIGGFRLGLEQAGHTCVGFCEIDKHAVKSYRAMHDTKGEWYASDITTVQPTDLPDADIYCGGFPCQSFSIAGKRGGFNDMRGTLIFEVLRLARVRQPKYLFLENVYGLLNHDNGQTFATILCALDECGYDCQWQVLNSSAYVPQNRLRIYIVGHLRGERRPEVFPITESDTEAAELQGQYANTITRRYAKSESGGSYIIEGQQPKQGEVNLIGNTNPSGHGMGGTIIDARGISPTITQNKGDGQKVAIPVLTPEREHKRQNGRRFKTDGEPAFTLTGQDSHGVAIYQRPRGNNKGGEHDIVPTLSSNAWHENNVLIDSMRIRKLTPLECWRLQGFPDELFYKAQAVNSNAQLYKQAGNSVTVPVIYDIAKRL